MHLLSQIFNLITSQFFVFLTNKDYGSEGGNKYSMIDVPRRISTRNIDSMLVEKVLCVLLLDACLGIMSGKSCSTSRSA